MQAQRGILLIILAISLFVVMGSLVKAAGRIPAGEAVFFRSFWAIPVIVAWLWRRGELTTGLRPVRWQNHAVRAIAGTSAMGLGFTGLHLLPLPEVTALRFVTPILIVILAAAILGERVRLFRLTAVVVGLVGVLVVMWPRLQFDGGQMALIGVFATLGSALLAALSQIILKSIAGTEQTSAIVFWFSATAACLSLLSAPFGWVWPVGWEWVWLVGAGVIGGVGQILITASYRYADASVLAPFTYVSMIWALIIGYFVFGEAPTVPMLAGAVLVISAGVTIVLRERHVGRRTAAEARVRSLMKDG